MPEINRVAWIGRALIVGRGGLGMALAEELQRRQPTLKVTLCGRTLGSDADWFVDLESAESLQALSQRLLEDPQPLRLVINATGRLHGASLTPEKRLQQVCADHLMESFAINAAGPLLLAKAIEPVLKRDRPFHFASLSARVGSIGDNHSGGWYSYRGSKAAQNMFLRSLSVEWARRFPLATVMMLHPGTTDTALSKPFQSFVPPDRLFSPQKAAALLLDVLLRQTAGESGRFLAWDGQEIPW
ncbi:short-chain dehydrogenase [Synechococcus sp. WH 8020]|uniref:SDR family NAD(P)-dependent oxidoreductase n=1 Tax=Synechococcus sp. (strain WH8020) TaxID=32052 RepID=UPI0006527394|nr:SDR family NAD(P)-dependent oxidoreductase [Synechococcus sp. WH 8020]AKN60404.1 short-chain dehydrogenase [Synechococcus sp. WH 8020]